MQGRQVVGFTVVARIAVAKKKDATSG
jgi:hypothetical protein